jgi:hypothetical protein
MTEDHRDMTTETWAFALALYAQRGVSETAERGECRRHSAAFRGPCRFATASPADRRRSTVDGRHGPRLARPGGPSTPIDPQDVEDRSVTGSVGGIGTFANRH